MSNPLFLRDPDDVCPRCGTNLRERPGAAPRPCPICTDGDAA